MAEGNQKDLNLSFSVGEHPESQHSALSAAKLGESLIAAVRAGQDSQVIGWLLPGSPAALALDIFGLALLRLDLRLDDPRENGQLAPYDLQIEPEVALLELGVITTLLAENGARPHLTRLFGSSLLLRPAPQSEFGWLVRNFAGQFRRPTPPYRPRRRTHSQNSPGLLSIAFAPGKAG